MLVATFALMVFSSTGPAYADFQSQTAGDRFVVTIAADGSLTVGGSGGSSDPLDERVVVSDCQDRLFTAGAAMVDCTVAFDEDCQGKPPDDADNRWRPAETMTRREVLYSQASRSIWTCLNFAYVAGGPSAAEVRAAMEAVLPMSEATTNPAVSPTTGMVETLVRLPVILHFDGDRELSVEQQLGGHRVRITAYAARFVWTVGDRTVDTDLVGRPWESRYPCDQHSCYGYLTAPAFDRVGRYPLSLSVQWSGSYQVDDGPVMQIPGTVTRVSPQLTINVREARAELITGDDEFR